ncbi:MAG: putative lipid II flippase FtsW [Eubacteriales bacterium]|nr:putative lipid II flippase FtsW [Eubacteriales bacterium]
MRKAGTWDGAERRSRERDPADKPGSIDFPIFISILLLCIIGLVVVFSASYYYAEDKFADGMYYVRNQTMHLGIALVAMLVLTRIDYRRLEKLAIPGLVISIALLIAVLAFGKEANSAKRWLIVGPVSVQPSEIAKFGMMLFMCMFMNRRRAVMEDFVHGLVPMLIVIAVVCGLVMLQPNMSMAVIIGMMGVILLYVGGTKPKYIALIGLAGVGLFILLAVVAPYRLARLTTFRDPWKDPQGNGYQLIQSLYALGSGGLFGQGLNGSRQKMLYMVYGESDFIFAILGEELGFCIAGAILLLYFFIVYRGIRVAMRCRDRFGSLLAAGITTVFAIQVAVNIGVVSGIMPTTGQTLPFISAGGSSLLLFMCAMGVLLNISRHTAEV